MAAPYPDAGVGTHYGDTSIVEDVTDIIYQITPEDTPFFSMSGEATSRAIVHEWQKRSLSTRNENSAAEGFTYTFTSAMTLPTRVVNVCQIFKKEIRVSNSEQAVGHYAISDSFADQMQLRLVEKKTDIEHTLLNGTIASGTATDESRYMEGFLKAVQDASTTYTTYSGAVTLSESNFNDAIQVSWEQGGEPRDVLVHGGLKREISAFSANNTKFIAADQQRQVNTISMYESDFFPVQIHLSRDMRSNASANTTGNAIAFVDRTMVRKAWLRRPFAKRIPETADSMDGVCVAELTLEWGNELAHHFIDNVRRI